LGRSPQGPFRSTSASRKSSAVRAWKDYDIALLKVETAGPELAARGPVSINFGSAFSAKCFDILGMSYWATELPGGRPGPEVPRYEWGKGDFIGHIDNWKIAVRSNVYKGFSGGPAFLAADAWHLVGLVISGREDRSETKLVRSLAAVEAELRQLVGQGNLRVLDSSPFPSRRFRTFSGLDFTSATRQDIDAYVDKVFAGRASALQFINEVSKERFAPAGSSARNKAVAVKGRDMLEHARLTMTKRRWDPDLFSRVIEKIIEAWELIGGGQDGDPRSVISSRLREDADYHERHCKTVRASERSECLKRLVAKREAIVLNRAFCGYHERAERYQTVLADDRHLEAPHVVYWARQSLSGLYEWSRALELLAGQPDGFLKANIGSTIRFLDGFPAPPAPGGWPMKIVYLSSAADKTVRGLALASEVRADDLLAATVEGKNRSLLERLCTKSLELLDRVEQSLDTLVYEQNRYRGDVKELSGRLNKGHCADDENADPRSPALR